MAKTLSKAFEEALEETRAKAASEPWRISGLLGPQNPDTHLQARKARTNHKGTVITTPQDGLESSE